MLLELKPAVGAVDWSNETQNRALERKHDLMYNVSRDFCNPSLGCTIEQYNRGTVFSTLTLAKPAEGNPANEEWAQWPGYPKCRGLGDTFGTSLYSIPEYEMTRESYRLTVQNAQSCNFSWVTPWLWLGGGGRRMVDAAHDGYIPLAFCVFICSPLRWRVPMLSAVLSTTTTCGTTILRKPSLGLDCSYGKHMFGIAHTSLASATGAGTPGCLARN